MLTQSIDIQKETHSPYFKPPFLTSVAKLINNNDISITIRLKNDILKINLIDPFI